MLAVEDISSLIKTFKKYNERLKRDIEGGTESIDGVVISHSMLGFYGELNESNRLIKKLMTLQERKHMTIPQERGITMDSLSKEKREWLRSIGAIGIQKYDYMILSNGHLYSSEYLNSKPLKEIKQEYESLFSVNDEEHK